MNRNFLQRMRALWHAEFFSPKDFVRRAGLIAVAFGLAQCFGLRQFTSILNGTTGSVNLSWETSALLGVVYIFLYLAWVLLVPTLLLAAGLLAAWRRVGPGRTIQHEPRTNSSSQN